MAQSAISLMVEWIVRHQDADGAWGGIQPPWIYSLMALKSEGYALDHPVVAKGLAGLDDPGLARGRRRGDVYPGAPTAPSGTRC